ncbi:MAG: family N-acetyltransferase [Ilumatobacteraceae bacterium]|nr:family N-acetyltransferase [Ilumatobacteraceae bacterium]
MTRVIPLNTARLRLRMMRPSDARVVAAYRGLPEVAKYQDWDLPYGLADAHRAASRQDDVDDITAGRWVSIAIERQSVLVGDIAVGLTDPGVAEIGYTLAPEHQGFGYMSEAVEAVVDALFGQRDVRRITASLDPQNMASMRVIEPLGFSFEALTHQSELIRGEWLDDMRFAVLRAQREAWRTRPRTPPADVRLVQIEPGQARQWATLQTHRFQRQFVSPVLESFADALHPPLVNGVALVPWYRGIVADGERVGFVMMSDVTDAHPHPFLWRLIIDRHHQRRGIATEVLRQLIDGLRAQGRTQLYVSYVVAPGGPEPLYRGLGFVPNGQVDGDETIAVLNL